MTCNCMGPQNGQPVCPCRMARYPLNYPAGTWDQNWSGAAPQFPAGVFGLTPPSPTFTDAMFAAYKGAIKALINSVPPEERAKRWKKNGNGWRIPEREKAEARWRALMKPASTD